MEETKDAFDRDDALDALLTTDLESSNLFDLAPPTEDGFLVVFVGFGGFYYIYWLSSYLSF